MSWRYGRRFGARALFRLHRLTRVARSPGGGQLHGGTKTTRRFDLHDDRGSDEDNYSQGLDTPPLKDRLRLRAGEPALEPVPSGLLRQYIGYARQYVQPTSVTHSRTPPLAGAQGSRRPTPPAPVLTRRSARRLSPDAATVLQEFYLELRSKHRTVDSTPITTRQLESMVRLAEARARIELRENVTAQDARDVVEIMRESLNQTYEDETGFVDYNNRSQHGTGARSKHSKTGRGRDRRRATGRARRREGWAVMGARYGARSKTGGMGRRAGRLTRSCRLRCARWSLVVCRHGHEQGRAEQTVWLCLEGMVYLSGGA